jgi:RimJ/RimL family protein N-acetyltransferase
VGSAIPEIETPRLLLRPWRDSDVEPYAEMNGDPEVRSYMFPPRPLTPAESVREIEAMVDQWHRLGFGHWAVELRETGELIGRTGAKRHDDWDLDPENTEVGWLYARSAWGQGFATEGALAAVQFCLEDVGRPEVISIAMLGNLASHRVMRKAGLEWAGVRRWYERRADVLWYSSNRTAEKTEAQE